MNKKHRRAETGPMAFGDDWPGVFVRGDNAAYYAMTLKQFLDDPDSLKDNIIMSSVLNGLVSTLSGCIVTPEGDPVDCQYIKDFNKVVVDKPKEK